MLIEFSDRAETLVSIYLYNMQIYLLNQDSDFSRDKLLQSACSALTQILTENSTATGYGEALKSIALERQ